LIVLEGESQVWCNNALPLDSRTARPKMVALAGSLIGSIHPQNKTRTLEKGITPVATGEQAIKIALVAMFFSADIAFVVQELRARRKLRRFIGIPVVPPVSTIYRFFSKCDEAQFISVISGILNSCCTHRRKQGNMTCLIDATALTLDLNWFRRTYSKKHLEEREFKWGYSPSHGHFIGYKLTLVIEYPSLHPVCMLPTLCR